MKTADVDFHFPLLGFTPDREIWGFPDNNTLTSCGPRTLKENMQADMELVDIDGRRWIVRSVRRVGRGRPFIPWLLSALLSTPQFRIEHELEQLESVTVGEVRARACVSLKAFRQDWAEVGNDPALAQRLAEVGAIRSIAEIHDVLGLDSFMAY
jgi:hypothetical protein